MKFNIEDKVICLHDTDWVSKGVIGKIIDIDIDDDYIAYLVRWNEDADNTWWIGEDDIKLLHEKNNTMKLRIKYFDGATKLKKITKGNWIDVYSREDVFVPSGEQRLIPLGFALELPQGWEGHLAPRSSTFKKWGIIQTNHVGVVDDTYIGDNDEWMMPVYCLKGRDYEYEYESLTKYLDNNIDTWIQSELLNGNLIHTNTNTGVVKNNRLGIWIHKGDKIGQFRVMEVMPELEFEEVELFGNKNRKGFGTTGSK